MLVVEEKNVPRTVRVVTPIALWAMTLLAIPHDIDTLTVWTMNLHIGHSILLYGRAEMPFYQYVNSFETPPDVDVIPQQAVVVEHDNLRDVPSVRRDGGGGLLLGSHQCRAAQH